MYTANLWMPPDSGSSRWSQHSQRPGRQDVCVGFCSAWKFLLEQHFVRKTFPTRPILNQRENTTELPHNKVNVLSSAFISKCLIVVTLYIAVFLSHQIPNDHMGNNRDHMVCRLNRCHHTWIIIRKSEGLMKPSCLLTLIISINLVWTYYNSC